MLAWSARLLLIVLCICGGCRRRTAPPPAAATTAPPPAPPDAWFEDVTEDSGLKFNHDAGPVGGYALPQIMGSGAALFDYDNDGMLDIYLVHNGGPRGAKNQLFHQEPGRHFRDVSEGSGLDVAGYGMGVAIGDVNNDGRPDVALCEYGGVRLFLNNGNDTFTEVTAEAGLPPAADEPIKPWATAATLCDLTRSGRLDLVVAYYVAYDPSRACTDSKGRPDYCGPADFAGAVTRVYRNLGWDISDERLANVPHFRDVTAQAGLGNAPSAGLGVVAADFDGDGWPDLFVANDGRPNQLWINQHDGAFKDEAPQRGLAYNGAGQKQANMGVAIGDINGAGLPSVYVTHLTDENNTLWEPGPKGIFTDRTSVAGLMRHGQGTGFGAVLADFDLDGSLDLAVVNGRVLRLDHSPADGESPELAPYWRAYAEKNQLFSGSPGGRFTDISAVNLPFTGTANVARGLACGDIFNDGRIGLLVTTVGGPARLYRNSAPRHGHWLEVRAIDPSLGGRDAYGAAVVVSGRGRKFTRWVNPSSSYLCGNDPRAHFGLGGLRRLDTIEITWPDGSREVFPASNVDCLLTLRKGGGRK